jgi:hypothetical protein
VWVTIQELSDFVLAVSPVQIDGVRLPLGIGHDKSPRSALVAAATP